jgi:hypothetical protein
MKNLLHTSVTHKLFVLAALSLGLAGTAAAQTGSRVVWSMKRTNQDSVALRLGGLTGAPTIFRRLVVSNGATPSSGTTAAPYSATRGQALAPTADGGGWSSTASGGPGVNPQRGFYEQFDVTASTATRLDSLLFTSVATSSPGGRVAVMYSRSNFTADSATITGAKSPAYAGFTSGTTTYPAFGGGVLPATANGSFPATGAAATTSAILPQFVSATGNTGTFRFELNGPTGVALATGQTLSVRLYFAINNSNPGRYILLKDVTLKGLAVTSAAQTARAQTGLAVYPNPMQDNLLVAHPAAPRGARVVAYSATGQPVATALVQPGAVSTDLGLKNLANGIYLVEYTDGQQRITAKVVKN